MRMFLWSRVRWRTRCGPLQGLSHRARARSLSLAASFVPRLPPPGHTLVVEQRLPISSPATRSR